jgi:uncharacterized protein YjcR
LFVNGIHPVTIHKWKREMSQETKNESIDVHEILEELKKLKEENNYYDPKCGCKI